MTFNIDFLLASLVFLLIILFHFMENRSLYFSNNRTFLWVIIIGILDICLDLICTVMISSPNTTNVIFLESCLVLVYILHTIVPVALLYHILSHITLSNPEKIIRFILCFVIPLLIIPFIVGNHWSKLLFTVSNDGIYSRGPYYLLVYITASMYLATTVLFSLIHYRSLGPVKIRPIIELVFLAGVTVLLQVLYKNVLLYCFGIAQEITVLFLTLNNPYCYTDTLTSAFDIRYFHDRCKQYTEHKKNYHIILIKLTQLARINFILGASIGNELLIKTAKQLRSFDKHNLVFRISGSQFIVMTFSIGQYHALLKNIHDFFAKPMVINKITFDCSPILCGIPYAQKPGDSDTLLAYTEYLTSLAPKNTATYFIPANDETLKGFRYNLEIESFMNTAIQQDLFEVVYQPVYSIKESKFVSAEALSRLTHPTYGPISPEIFIRIAERHGYIAEIGLLQFKKICAFVQNNPNLIETLESININLSPVELMRPGNIENLINIIHEFKLPPSFFHFEITETVATEYSANLNALTQKFKKEGIGLCLDDFGSGYANLNSVLRLPFTIIKLDRSLLSNICNDQRTALLYESIVHALKNMGFSITSEGIETTEELKTVTNCGVDYIQGFYFSRPLNSEDFLKLLVQNTAEQ